jgi:hypothetical protein
MAEEKEDLKLRLTRASEMRLREGMMKSECVARKRYPVPYPK